MVQIKDRILAIERELRCEPFSNESVSVNLKQGSSIFSKVIFTKILFVFWQRIDKGFHILIGEILKLVSACFLTIFIVVDSGGGVGFADAFQVGDTIINGTQASILVLVLMALPLIAMAVRGRKYFSFMPM